MKNKLLVLLCLLTLGSVTAQVKLSKDYSYSVSKPYKVFDGDKTYFTYKGEVLVFKKNKKNILVQKFDAVSLKELVRTEYKIKDLFPKNYEIEGIEQIKENVFIYYSSWDGGKNKKERLFVKKMNFSEGKLIEGFDKQIFSIDGKVSGTQVRTSGGFGLKIVDKFNIIKIKNVPNFLVKYRRKPKVKNDKKSHDIIGLKVFDKDLNEIWGSEFKMPYTERQMDIIDYAIDFDANIYVLVKKYFDNSNKDKRKDESNYQLELFKYEKSTKELIVNKINIGDNYISELGLYVNDKKEIYCAGYYNNGESWSDVDGVVVFKTDEIENVPAESFYEIPVEILNQYVSKKAAKKNKKKEKKDEAEFKSLKLRKLIFHEDGGIDIIGEQFYIKEHISHSSKGMRIRYTYHYNDILVSKINASGSLDWMRKIPKRQKGLSGEGGMSFTHFYTNNNHYLVYLDNIKNIKLPLDKAPAYHTDKMGGYLTACKINYTTGDVTKGAIFDSRRLKGGLAAFQFKTDRIQQTKDNEFVIEVYKKKKQDILIKVKIVEEENIEESKL